MFWNYGFFSLNQKDSICIIYGTLLSTNISLVNMLLICQKKPTIRPAYCGPRLLNHSSGQNKGVQHISLVNLFLICPKKKKKKSTIQQAYCNLRLLNHSRGQNKGVQGTHFGHCTLEQFFTQ